MSPILLRPVREQLEHDRVIRLLQAKYRRKFEVAVNPGNEQTAPVTVGQLPWYPDLVLHAQDRGRRVLGVVEVETAESVNNLEAMSQWATFARLRARFHLYIPATSIDVAKRLCGDHQISVTELWAYDAIGDQIRFALVQRSGPKSDDTRRAAPSKKAASAAKRATAGRTRAGRPSAARPPARRAVAAGVRKSASPKVGTRAATRTNTSRSPRTRKRK